MVCRPSLQQDNSTTNKGHMGCLEGLFELAWEPKIVVAIIVVLDLLPPLLLDVCEVVVG